MEDKILVWRGCGILGDTIMVSHFVKMLRMNGYDAYLSDVPSFSVLLDVPHGISGIPFEAAYEGLDRSESIMSGLLGKFARQFNVPKPKMFIGPPPIKFKDMSEVIGADVAICVKSGFWSEIRDWPYFEELKLKLHSNGITFVDVNAKIAEKYPTNTKTGETAIMAANLVKKSKIYVGLETGLSHLAAGLIEPGNGIIIQSGYALPDYWAEPYSGIFHIVQRNECCKPCFKRNKSDCQYNHNCMKQITVDMIFDKIKELCDKKSKIV